MALRGSWNHHTVARTSTNNLPERSRAGTATAAASAIDSPGGAVDPFLLDFGTSVHVNEDLRRSIRREIQDMDDSIAVTVNETKKEETMECHLNQDLHHSHSEMTNLHRGATDQMETANVHGSFLSGLQHTLQVALVEASDGGTGGRSSNTAPFRMVVSSERHGGDAAATVEQLPHASHGATTATATRGGSGGGSKHESNKQVIRARSEKLQTITANMKETSKEVDELFQQHQVTVNTIVAIQKRIESEALESVLETKTQEGDRVLVDFKVEEEKLQALKLNTQKARTQGGSNAQHLADFTKQLDSDRRAADMEKTKLSEQLKAAKELEARHERTCAAAKAKVETMTSQFQEYQDLEDFAKRNIEYQATIEKEEVEQKELLRMKAELVAQLEESHKQVAERKTDLEAAQAFETKAVQLQAENDEKHDAIVVPGRVEISEIAETKETLAKEIEEIHRSSAEMGDHEKEHLASKLDTKTILLDELDSLQKEAKGVQAKMETFERAKNESKENWEAEITDHMAVQHKLKAAIDAEKAHWEEVLQALTTREKASLEEATNVAQDQREKEDRLLRILNKGANIIDKAEVTIRQMGEPFVL